MAIISNCACLDSLVIVITIAVGLVTYLKWASKYWQRRNVPYLEPNFPFGTMPNPFQNPEPFGELNKKQYNYCKAKGYKHVGLFSFLLPVYMPIDPEYVKNIMTRDFDHFVDRGFYYNEKDDPVGAHLFAIEGAKWKNLRMKLTPTFTSGKMKQMFQTFIECGYQLKNFMDELSLKNEPVDIKDVLGRFTTDIIGSCAFGLECNSFKDPNSEFRNHLKTVFVFTKFEVVKGLFTFIAPNFSRSLGIRFIRKELSDFIMGVVKETVEFREKNNVVRNDFMQLLIDLKNNTKTSDGQNLTIEEVAAQSFLFLFAGYETSSTTMTFCLYELAKNPDIQQKVREEINEVLEKQDGKITYDAIMEMKYLGQVVDETLRKYPPVPVLNRMCVADYKVPGTDLIIQKGTAVLLPAIALQHDEHYFPDAEKFDPERFSEKNKHKINPFTYMPFGEGPRICIGVRFGLLQTKVGLAVLLKNYVFSVNNKTPTPLKFDPASFFLLTLGDIWLDVKKVE